MPDDMGGRAPVVVAASGSRANIAAAGLVSLETAARMTLSTVRMVQGFSRRPPRPGIYGPLQGKAGLNRGDFGVGAVVADRPGRARAWCYTTILLLNVAGGFEGHR